jgi:hypothetical protein
MNRPTKALVAFIAGAMLGAYCVRAFWKFRENAFFDEER